MSSRETGEELVDLLGRINVDRSHGERRPHKPLLLLLAIARLVGRGDRSLSFRQVEPELGELLHRFAPPVRKVNAGNPWWRLCNDGLWEIAGSDRIDVDASGIPEIGVLRGTVGGLPERFATALLGDAALVQRAVGRILSDHFDPTWHETVLEAVGLGAPSTALTETAGAVPPAELVRESVDRWRRPSTFAQAVMHAYDHRCALTGYRATMGGVPIAVEAAHLHWHCKGGPASVENGLALNPTLHRLLDFGAWSLDDDRRVIVSDAYREDPAAHAYLQPLGGRRVRDPRPGFPPLHLDHIRWHREPTLGGVFRG